MSGGGSSFQPGRSFERSALEQMEREIDLGGKKPKQKASSPVSGGITFVKEAVRRLRSAVRARGSG